MHIFQCRDDTECCKGLECVDYVCAAIGCIRPYEPVSILQIVKKYLISLTDSCYLVII